MDASAVARNPSIFLCERTGPDYFSIFIKTEKQALNAVDVNISGLHIASGARPSDAIKGDSRMEDVELMVPEQFARFRIKAGDALLLRDVLSDAPDDVDAAVHHNRCGTPDEFCLPQKVLSLGRPG